MGQLRYRGMIIFYKSTSQAGRVLILRVSVVVAVLGRGIRTEQRAREPQHVVGAARLHALRGVDVLREVTRWEEVLDVPVPTGREGALADHGAPEEARRAEVLWLARQLVEAIVFY